ncbi:succinate dehydrogenase assembly factor 4 [Sneathiella limimaris]|uniref:succinate dehydrogenase assembly factor 4 n=1 Tax=Sneathiella limimaris TaxID=1964213 RepID=UPI0019D0CEBE|nr:succinate dehydrogenase assembly factor 4 [Sneathiella limimaris]
MEEKKPSNIPSTDADADKVEKTEAAKPAHKLKQADGEIGGPAGLEPTRYGDWERKGIVSDF